jgi:hypothetical protein
MFNNLAESARKAKVVNETEKGDVCPARNSGTILRGNWFSNSRLSVTPMDGPCGTPARPCLLYSFRLLSAVGLSVRRTGCASGTSSAK